MFTLGGGECHLALEDSRQGVIELPMLAADHGAVRRGDPNRRHRRAGAHVAAERSAKIEQSRPLLRILGAGNLAVGAVHERVAAIAEQAAVGDLGGVQLLSHHGLDGIAPERDHRANSRRRRVQHHPSPGGCLRLPKMLFHFPTWPSGGQAGTRCAHHGAGTMTRPTLVLISVPELETRLYGTVGTCPAFSWASRWALSPASCDAFSLEWNVPVLVVPELLLALGDAVAAEVAAWLTMKLPATLPATRPTAVMVNAVRRLRPPKRLGDV